MAGDDTHIHDLIIIGAGPCGLALAARLHESTPSALFTDSEHQKYHWMKASNSTKHPKAHRTSRRSNTATDRLLRGPSLPFGSSIDLAVLDAHSDEWMRAWNSKFDDLRISHLRSPMFFHPDPSDRDALLGFAYREGREKELKEIGGVVGKALSKHQRKSKMKSRGRWQQETSYLDERDRNDYFRPSQALFKQFCQDVVKRYGLGNSVQKSEVISIAYTRSSTSSSRGVFKLETSTGVKKARIVVFAVGAGLHPSLPPGCPFCGLEKTGSVTHAFMDTPFPHFVKSKAQSNLPTLLLRKIAARKQTNVMVVGGGLTSAQIVDTAISAGVSKVWHIIRSRMKVKHFDVDLPWVGKYKNYHLATFWSADDDEERFKILRNARGGGSVTPEYKKILQSLEYKNRLSIHTETQITGADWNEESQTWEVETEPKIEGLPRIDHVVYATGLPSDVRGIKCLRDLFKEKEVDCVDGLPCLTDDLMWSEDLPLFITGRLASLRLGPGAGNLEGARMGAERVAWKIGELLREWNGRDDVFEEEGGDEVETRDSGYGSVDSAEVEKVDSPTLGLGVGNQFSVLKMGDEEAWRQGKEKAVKF